MVLWCNLELAMINLKLPTIRGSSSRAGSRLAAILREVDPTSGVIIGHADQLRTDVSDVTQFLFLTIFIFMTLIFYGA